LPTTAPVHYHFPIASVSLYFFLFEANSMAESLEQGEETLLPKAGPFKPCPRCGAEGAKRVLFTPWGSFYGPALFNHVRCPECRCAYNGRSGGSNLIPAILFVAVPLILMAAIIIYMVMLIIPRL
jgi:hypothetical protein